MLEENERAIDNLTNTNDKVSKILGDENEEGKIVDK